MKPKVKKMRLDELIVARGAAASRSQAKALIIAGKVRTSSEVLDKPGKVVPEDIEIEVVQPPRYVSRGGEKLDGFLERFPFSVEGARILDVGASTGGFTDCLLQRGAAEAICIDVGRAQMHNKLLQDPRVTNFEQINARHLSPGDLPHDAYDIIVMDLSFISLKLVLPAVWPFLKPGGRLVCLIKPQFEATREEADRFGGIIRDETIRDRIVNDVRTFALTLPNAEEFGFAPSQITGTDGNQEFLLGIQRKA